MEELSPFTEERPWGGYREFTLNALSTVKMLFVKKGEQISLQKHYHRIEFWRVLSGHPDITIGDKIIKAEVGQEFEVPPETNHRISAPADDVEILEIAQGEFDENDIVRIEDKYGRV